MILIAALEAFVLVWIGTIAAKSGFLRRHRQETANPDDNEKRACDLAGASDEKVDEAAPRRSSSSGGFAEASAHPTDNKPENKREKWSPQAIFRRIWHIGRAALCRLLRWDQLWTFILAAAALCTLISYQITQPPWIKVGIDKFCYNPALPWKDVPFNQIETYSENGGSSPALNVRASRCCAWVVRSKDHKMRSRPK
jgi:hypothetical protein